MFESYFLERFKSRLDRYRNLGEEGNEKLRKDVLATPAAKGKDAQWEFDESTLDPGFISPSGTLDDPASPAPVFKRLESVRDRRYQENVSPQTQFALDLEGGLRKGLELQPRTIRKPWQKSAVRVSRGHRMFDAPISQGGGCNDAGLEK